ncbi:hypothetical protein [Gemmatimonas sp.]
MALAGLVAAAAPASAAGQSTTPPANSAAAPLPRWHVGGTIDAGQPVGAFKRHVNNAVGLHAYGLLRLDRFGVISLRFHGGWLNYGREGQRSCLGTAPHCRVTVNLTTANGILSVAVGPQLAMPLGRVRAYSYGLVGMSRFATLSGLDGRLVPDLVGASENYADGGVVLSGGVGLQIPVHRRTSLDVGVSYESHGTRNYLIKGGLTDQPDGSLGFDIKRSPANLYAVRVGLTIAMGGRPRRTAATP